MKTTKNTKQSKTTTTTPATPAPRAPSVRAIMYRISSLTAAAARHIADGRADALPEIMREINTAARNYWKTEHKTA